MDENKKTKMLEKVRAVLDKYQITPDRIDVVEAPVYNAVKVYLKNPVGRKLLRTLSADVAIHLSTTPLRAAFIEGGFSLEIPKEKEDIFYPHFSNAIQTPDWARGKKLPLFLGYGEGLEPVTLDLTEAPNILIAGTTMQGKSVLLRSLIDSLLVSAPKRKIKFFMGDPKLIEFTDYTAIDKDCFWDEGIVQDYRIDGHLHRLCDEMDRRYRNLERCKCASIKEYNYTHDDMPYIVVVIDEYPDFMFPVPDKGKESMDALVRLAQKGRSVGIHCIISTQRPDFRSIPGILKANFPTRIAVRCASRDNSLTILDDEGAEYLIGRGDMLFSDGKSLTRFQGLYEDSDGKEEAIEKFNGQSFLPIEPLSETFLHAVQHKAVFPDISAEDCGIALDKDFLDAASLVVTEKVASISNLQRRLAWGFAKASRIMDALVVGGIVGPLKSDLTRDILIQTTDELEEHIKLLRKKK